MKRFTVLLLALTALTALTAFTSPASADGRRARVRHGIATGQLTRAEAARLRVGQMHIRRLQKMAWADGRLTPRERALIHRAKAQHSRVIFRLKHNGRVA